MGGRQQGFDVHLDADERMPEHVQHAAKEEDENADQAQVVAGRERGRPRRARRAATQQERRHCGRRHREESGIADPADGGDGRAIDVCDDGAHIENIEPSFIARPMSPLTFSLPDMNSICPDCLLESMSSQSWAAIDSVRFGVVAGPGLTVQAPSLMTAFHVPPPSPLTSYWMVALVPDALSGRKRP